MADISASKGGNILEVKLINLQHTVITRISETCKGASMNLRGVARLELIKQKMKWVIYLQAASRLSHYLNSSNKHFCQLLNVHEFSDVRQTDRQTDIQQSH
jgi:hypothetical protein